MQGCEFTRKIKKGEKMIKQSNKNNSSFKKVMRYAIWNNKGGVGKTFLSFVIACEYAIKHPDARVVLIDLCPQANLSEIVLGGNGKGSIALNTLLQQKKRPTIGGYFDERIQNPHNKTGNESSYLLPKLQGYNSNLPKNLYLVAGDPSLEIQTQAINQISAQTLPVESWANVHKWVIDLISGIQAALGDPVFFIDCNPSFAAYTELAVLAAERLIVPCTADGSSARAIDNIGRLIYGVDLPAEYKEIDFSQKAKKHGFSLPSIHIVSMNRSTQYDTRASKAFGAMFAEIVKRVTKMDSKGVAFSSIKEKRFVDVPDAHTVSVVCSYEGMPLSKLKMGGHQVHDLIVQVNPEPFKRYQEAVDNLVSLL